MTTPSSLQLNKLIAITYCNIVFVAIGMATPKSSRTIATKILQQKYIDAIYIFKYLHAYSCICWANQ